MEAYQERVIQEEAELATKLDKLETFLGKNGDAGTFNGLPEAERERLLRQEKAMREYREVLKERIAAF